jgi:pimeloyl-ACP methyl ester carboxylesterase
MNARASTTAAPARTYPVTHHRTAVIDGINIFYREAGPADGPAVVLLHGFPTSSHMFRNLIPTLADRYHVIAPDYPGFGQSGAPIAAASPIRLIASVSWWTACSTSSAPRATRCT